MDNHWKVHFTMRVDTKDERFRLTFMNLEKSRPAVNTNILAISAYHGPVTLQGDMDRIKPALLRFGDNILTSLISKKASNDW